jgi:hypothetical protein
MTAPLARISSLCLDAEPLEGRSQEGIQSPAQTDFKQVVQATFIIGNCLKNCAIVWGFLLIP